MRHGGGTAKGSGSGSELADPAEIPGETRAVNHEAERRHARAVELQRRGDLEQAQRAFGEVLDLHPDHGGALVGLGHVLRLRGLRTAAAAVLRRASRVLPRDATVRGTLGLTLRELGEPEAALAELYRAVELAPNQPETQQNLGLALTDLGHFAEAERCFEKSLRLQPEPTTELDLALCRLAAGDYRQGFAGLEARWKLRRLPRPHANIPLWDGRPLDGRRILVFNEQAYGDGILFARFVKRLRGAGASAVVLECHRPLARLFAVLEGIDRVVVRGEAMPAVDCCISLLSLPALLGIEQEEIEPGPYLIASAVGRPPLERPPEARLAVGLCWAGRPTHRMDRHRSAGLKAFLPLLGRPGTAYYSLQKGAAAAELAHLGVGGLVRDLSTQIDDLADAAHWMAQMDLVITVDTAIAHLAGALDIPCWVVLPFLVDWRWGRVGDETHWYERTHLFRQPRPGDWASVFAEIDDAMAQVLDNWAKQ